MISYFWLWDLVLSLLTDRILNNNVKIRCLITMGDPSGIGPEIILKAFTEQAGKRFGGLVGYRGRFCI